MSHEAKVRELPQMLVCGELRPTGDAPLRRVAQVQHRRVRGLCRSARRAAGTAMTDNLPDQLRRHAKAIEDDGYTLIPQRMREAADTIEAAEAMCARRGCAPPPAPTGQEHHLDCVNRPDCCCGREGCRTTPRLQRLEDAVRRLERKSTPVFTTPAMDPPSGDIQAALAPIKRAMREAFAQHTRERNAPDVGTSEP